MQACISTLKILGYGNAGGREEGRLDVYAQVANGVLCDAIDMIEDERKAWEVVAGEISGARMPGGWS